jgi:hypothetical protein
VIFDALNGFRTRVQFWLMERRLHQEWKSKPGPCPCMNCIRQYPSAYKMTQVYYEKPSIFEDGEF